MSIYDSVWSVDLEIPSASRRKWVVIQYSFCAMAPYEFAVVLFIFMVWLYLLAI